MLGRFVRLLHLLLLRGVRLDRSEFTMGIGKSRRVPFLTGGLVLLIGFFARAVELFAISLVEIT